MKKKEDFAIRKVAGQIVMVPLKETAMKFNGMIIASEVAEFIWNNIEKIQKPEEMVGLVMDEFEGDPKEIENDVNEFMDNLIKAGWIE